MSNRSGTRIGLCLLIYYPVTFGTAVTHYALELPLSTAEYYSTGRRCSPRNLIIKSLIDVTFAALGDHLVVVDSNVLHRRLMSHEPPSGELESPQSIQEILRSMDPDELRTHSHHLRESYELIYEEPTDGVVIALPSASPSPSTLRAVIICRDIAALLETAAGP